MSKQMKRLVPRGECSGCRRMFTENSIHKCPARNWICPKCDRYGHLDGLCELYRGGAISFDFPLGKVARQSLPLKNECGGCGRPNINFHVCPARDWYCEDCDVYGHLDGLCDVFCGEEISYDSLHDPYAYPYGSEWLKEREEKAFCKVARESASLQEVTKEHHVNPGMCNAIKRSAEHSELYDALPGQKRPRCTDPDKHELNFFIDRVEALRRENQTLKQRYESVKDTNNSLVIKRKGEKSLVKQINSLTQTGKELNVELNKMKTEKTKLKSQRDHLFAYSEKLEAHAKKLATLVDHLTSDHRYIMDRVYPGWPTANLPPWSKGRCMRCGSSRHHEEFDCIANGNVCQQCFKINHFTTVCKSAPSYTIAASKKENKVIGEVKADIAASK